MNKRMIRSAGLAALVLGTALSAQAQGSVTLYGRVVAGVDYQSNVYDPATGITTGIGETNHGSMFGVGLADWVMFGFNRDGEILDIDRKTGAATVIAEPGHDFWGAATNPLRWD